jgi:hypothetical protein
MLLLAMAEIIRRAAEDALALTLSEEDEIGFGQWMAGARKALYGSERVLDASREVSRDFLTSMGLDYGIKVRCYVEGDTELGALTSAVGNAGGIEFINLRGQFVERRGRGLNFVDSLKNDIKSHVFSVVILDEDRDDHVRAVKRAAATGDFFGRFFVSSPDFEFSNFTINELAEILLNFVERERAQITTISEVLEVVSNAKSGKQFFQATVHIGFQEVGKSEAWGVALMNYASQHRTLPRGHSRAGETRPVIEIAELLMRARDVGYLRSLDGYRVDPDTGELQRK